MCDLRTKIPIFNCVFGTIRAVFIHNARGVSKFYLSFSKNTRFEAKKIGPTRESNLQKQENCVSTSIRLCRGQKRFEMIDERLQTLIAHIKQNVEILIIASKLRGKRERTTERKR